MKRVLSATLRTPNSLHCTDCGAGDVVAAYDVHLADGDIKKDVVVLCGKCAPSKTTETPMNGAVAKILGM